mmetsp:Transcript_11127/g.24519  ORF Transcript_11127/g.24519 Transcript_11127/m.24519 type:complete len:258 (-) Transcript_11127:387-1160(-)
MLHHQNVTTISQLHMLQHLPNHMSRSQPLLHIQIRTRLVKHVHIRYLHRHSRNSKTLKLSPTQHGNITIQHVSKLPRLGSPLETIPSFRRRPFILLLENIPHQSPHRTGNMIHILRLDRSLDVILQNLGEVILQIRSTEMNQNLLPIRRTIVSSEIGLHLSSKNLQGGRLSNTIGTDQSQHLSRTRHGKTMQLEAVGSVTMGGIAFQILGKVDNVDCLKRTFFDADTTSNTEWFGEVGNLGLWAYFDTEFAKFDNGT